MLDELEARVRRLEAALEDLEAAGVATLSSPASSSREPYYPTLEDWVTEHFAPMYGRPLGGEFRWCPRWFEHAEAISRLEALWRSWETLRLDPGTGMAGWYRDHLDHQLPILLVSRGPLSRCSSDRHEASKPLPVGL